MRCEKCLCVAPLLLATILSGCSGKGDKWTKNLPETVPAKGIVTLDGKPVEGAIIVFAPAVESGGYAANAASDRNGRFELSAFPSKSGAVPGSYNIQVSKTEEVKASAKKFDPGLDAAHAPAEEAENFSWQNVLPQKYASPVTSGITLEIPAEGTTELKIELTSK